MKLIKFLIYPFLIIKSVFNLFIIYLPGDPGIKLRYIYYRKKFKSCGENVFIDTGVLIDGFEYISIGSNVHIDKYTIINTGIKTVGHQHFKKNSDFNHNVGEIIIGDNTHIVHHCILMGFGGIQIEENCTISAGSKLYSQSNLAYNPKEKCEIISIMPYEQAHFINSPIILQRNVWVGLNCIIMPGCSIKKNSFAVSNSILLDKYPENSYISGQPGIKIRNRFE
ncbi:MAG: hypothetical protein H6587_09370 [Flavobacteriales bacterium]|nr:hypothetical protein [Flavobacteriales bacterium]MCB9364765.1 hypothetical protein [Flavobacteriales bacterium]